MIGFIKKDLAMIKSNFKFLALLIIVYSFMGVLGKMDISFILPFISVLVMISTFSYDAYNKWDAYSATLPDGRKNSVKAKYLSTILLVLVMTILTTILSFIISYFNKSINTEQILITMCGTIAGTLLVLIFMYPVIYKFGIEKARIGMFVGTFGLIIIGGLIITYFDISFSSKVLEFLENYLIIILVITVISLLYISYKISERIVLKKEF